MLCCLLSFQILDRPPVSKGASFLDPPKVGARFGKGKDRANNIVSGSLAQGGLGTPGPRTPQPQSTQLATHSPHTRGWGWQRETSELFTSRGPCLPDLAKSRGSAHSGPSLLCPKGHHPGTLALWGTLRAAGGCRPGRGWGVGGVPTGHRHCVSCSPGAQPKAIPSECGQEANKPLVSARPTGSETLFSP